VWFVPGMQEFAVVKDKFLEKLEYAPPIASVAVMRANVTLSTSEYHKESNLWII